MTEENNSSESYLDKRRRWKQFGKPKEEKKVYVIPKIGAKKKKEIEEQKLSGDNKLDLFFEEARTKMCGRCLFCNGKTEASNDETYRRSIAHLLPKAIFESVATHPCNWIELCFFGESCHTNFDNGIISLEMIKDSAEWGIIREKLLILLPLVSLEERKNKLFSKLEALVNSK